MNNKYVGMSLPELENEESIKKWRIGSLEREIETKKKELKEYKTQLAMILQAKENVQNIQYEIIAEVVKHTRYDSTDRRFKIYFGIEIMNCNKLDNSKARSVVSSSTFCYNNKQKLLQNLIGYIECYQITKVYLQEGVTINKAELKKVFPKILIIEKKKK